MHRGYRFDVRDVLRDGDNELTVDFAARPYADRQASQDSAPRPHVNRHPYNAIRKMACNFGWDWGPDLVTAGIWRPVRWSPGAPHGSRAVRPLVDVDGGTGTVDVHVDLERAAGGSRSRVDA